MIRAGRWLRALVALLESCGLIHSAVWWFKAFCNFWSRECDAFFGFHVHYLIHRHTCRQNPQTQTGIVMSLLASLCTMWYTDRHADKVLTQLQGLWCPFLVPYALCCIQMYMQAKILSRRSNAIKYFFYKKMRNNNALVLERILLRTWWKFLNLSLSVLFIFLWAKSYVHPMQRYFKIQNK